MDATINSSGVFYGTVLWNHNTIKEPGSSPTYGASTVIQDGNNNHLNDYENAVGKTGGPDGGFVDLGPVRRGT